jgi:hypothetical protein
LTKVCAHNFYLYLVTVHSSSIANTQRKGMGSRDRRPSDKVAAQREAVREKQKKLKVNKEERRTIRNKKAVQKAKQQAGMPTDSEDEFEAWANPVVCPFILIHITC